MSDVRVQAREIIKRLQSEGKPSILDIGSGTRRRGTITLDSNQFEDVDIVWDILEGLPFADSALDGIIMFHVLEHLPVDMFQSVFYEMWRCCKPGGTLHIRTPHFSCGLMAWSDPTHVRPFSVRTFREYLCESQSLHHNSKFPNLPAFKPVSVTLHYYAFREDRHVRLGILAKALDWLANLTPWVQRQFERRLAYIFGGFEEVDAILQVIKQTDRKSD